MKHLTESEYQKRFAKIQKRNQQIEYRRALREERRKLKPNRKIETSKLLVFYLFLLLNVIVVYALFAMWVFADLSYLGVMITDIAAQVIAYGIYCLKAYNAKKSEEALRFERERLSAEYANPTEEIGGDEQGQGGQIW